MQAITTICNTNIHFKNEMQSIYWILNSSMDRLLKWWIQLRRRVKKHEYCTVSIEFISGLFFEKTIHRGIQYSTNWLHLNFKVNFCKTFVNNTQRKMWEQFFLAWLISYLVENMLPRKIESIDRDCVHPFMIVVVVVSVAIKCRRVYSVIFYTVTLFLTYCICILAHCIRQ